MNIPPSLTNSKNAVHVIPDASQQLAKSVLCEVCLFSGFRYYNQMIDLRDRRDGSIDRTANQVRIKRISHNLEQHQHVHHWKPKRQKTDNNNNTRYSIDVYKELYKELAGRVTTQFPNEASFKTIQDRYIDDILELDNAIKMYKSYQVQIAKYQTDLVKDTFLWRMTMDKMQKDDKNKRNKNSSLQDEEDVEDMQEPRKTKVSNGDNSISNYNSNSNSKHVNDDSLDSHSESDSQKDWRPYS